MPKIVSSTHIYGEAGVIRFAEYCNKHSPYIIFREVLKSDFGIDGEVELTKINIENKIEPLGEIIKVQIKTTASDNSYIRSESTTSFEFYPRQDDLDYWQRYKKNGIEVLLIVYDQRKDALYCKKVFDTDIVIAKEFLKIGKKRNTNAITFHKIDNLLVVGDNSFGQKFTNDFKSRISFNTKEYLLTNISKYQQHPKILYAYESICKNKKAIFEKIVQDEAPPFVIYNSILYTFFELGGLYTPFKSKVLKEADSRPHIITYFSILEDRKIRNHYTELLNIYLKDFLYSKKLSYQKDYNRFYFYKPRDLQEVKVNATTRKRGAESTKTVVKYFEYGELKFFRHIAVECKHLFLGSDVYLLLLPKYYFSKDGKLPMPSKIISKLTNTLTSQEYNSHYCDWIHFWWSFLSRGDDSIVVFEDPAYKTLTAVQPKSFYAKHIRLSLLPFAEIPVDFGIPTDKKERKKIVSESPSIQSTLF